MPGNLPMYPDYYAIGLSKDSLAPSEELQKRLDWWDELPWWRKLWVKGFNVDEEKAPDRVKADRDILFSRRNPESRTAKKTQKKVAKVRKQEERRAKEAAAWRKMLEDKGIPHD